GAADAQPEAGARPLQHPLEVLLLALAADEERQHLVLRQAERAPQWAAVARGPRAEGRAAHPVADEAHTAAGEAPLQPRDHPRVVGGQPGGAADDAVAHRLPGGAP